MDDSRGAVSGDKTWLSPRMPERKRACFKCSRSGSQSTHSSTISSFERTTGNSRPARRSCLTFDSLRTLARRVEEEHAEPVCAVVESEDPATRNVVHDTVERRAGASRPPTTQKVKGSRRWPARPTRLDSMVLAVPDASASWRAIWLPDPRVREERELARFRMHLVNARRRRGGEAPVHDHLEQRPAQVRSAHAGPTGRGGRSPNSTFRSPGEATSRRSGRASSGDLERAIAARSAAAIGKAARRPTPYVTAADERPGWSAGCPPSAIDLLTIWRSRSRAASIDRREMLGRATDRQFGERRQPVGPTQDSDRGPVEAKHAVDMDPLLERRSSATRCIRDLASPAPRRALRMRRQALAGTSQRRLPTASHRSRSYRPCRLSARDRPVTYLDVGDLDRPEPCLFESRRGRA